LRLRTIAFSRSAAREERYSYTKRMATLSTIMVESTTTAFMSSVTRARCG